MFPPRELQSRFRTMTSINCVYGNTLYKLSYALCAHSIVRVLSPVNARGLREERALLERFLDLVRMTVMIPQ